LHPDSSPITVKKMNSKFTDGIETANINKHFAELFLGSWIFWLLKFSTKIIISLVKISENTFQSVPKPFVTINTKGDFGFRPEGHNYILRRRVHTLFPKIVHDLMSVFTHQYSGGNYGMDIRLKAVVFMMNMITRILLSCKPKL
jgi:hypothetical protein